ncbi:acyl-CoA Delta(11) desaturase [Cimex lectularius]|uniref:Fatty acid desaturase domain-containing protein n=1 Tax=Cimex lectularius TaxID=79782 RepID=A0A8I6TFN8_CIMLE|nr:acyl-CoA Delta(11) desaturase [Cimex lectularius]XP_014252719.1 acyl-CoA Delta(11) desaturase [Cimex lectularius]XP_014252720.1 acyl-CoA Delta(11) desaturase [Cimex lectularius]
MSPNLEVKRLTDHVLIKKDVDETKENVFVPRWRFPDLGAQLFLHLGGLYGLYLAFTSAKWQTNLWTFFLVYASGVGITAGAHRLWSHKSYKAKWPLRLLLAFLFTIAGQRHIYMWALDHRVHHKYSESDSDPHDARRGFWFSHVGWLVLTPKPEVEAKRAQVDMSDLEHDPIVMWQKRLFIPLFAIITIAIPVLVPWYYWDEDIITAFFLPFNTRFSATLNIAFSVNSFAHMYGNKPYDKFISPVENWFVSMSALGEGWHNYHHVFPWDYKTSEFGAYAYNLTTGFIDLMARIGWAYDRKTASYDMVKRKALKSGDGTWPSSWGYGDPDTPYDQVELVDKKN